MSDEGGHPMSDEGGHRTPSVTPLERPSVAQAVVRAISAITIDSRTPSRSAAPPGSTSSTSHPRPSSRANGPKLIPSGSDGSKLVRSSPWPIASAQPSNTSVPTCRHQCRHQWCHQCPSESQESHSCRARPCAHLCELAVGVPDEGAIRCNQMQSRRNPGAWAGA